MTMPGLYQAPDVATPKRGVNPRSLRARTTRAQALLTQHSPTGQPLQPPQMPLPPMGVGMGNVTPGGPTGYDQFSGGQQGAQDLAPGFAAPPGFAEGGEVDFSGSDTPPGWDDQAWQEYIARQNAGDVPVQTPVIAPQNMPVGGQPQGAPQEVNQPSVPFDPSLVAHFVDQQGAPVSIGPTTPEMERLAAMQQAMQNLGGGALGKIEQQTRIADIPYADQAKNFLQGAVSTGLNTALQMGSPAGSPYIGPNAAQRSQAADVGGSLAGGLVPTNVRDAGLTLLPFAGEARNALEAQALKGFEFRPQAPQALNTVEQLASRGVGVPAGAAMTPEQAVAALKAGGYSDAEIAQFTANNAPRGVGQAFNVNAGVEREAQAGAARNSYGTSLERSGDPGQAAKDAREAAALEGQYQRELQGQGQVVRVAVNPEAVTPLDPNSLMGSRGAVELTDPAGARILGPGEQPGPGEVLMHHGTGEAGVQGDLRPGTNLTPDPKDAQVFARTASRLEGGGLPVTPESQGSSFYHGTSPQNALEWLGEGTVPGRGYGGQYGAFVSDAPDMALGQHGSGALVELDRSLVNTREARPVGQSPEMAQLGTNHIVQSAEPNAVRSVTFQPDKMDRVTTNTIKNGVEDGLYVTRTNADGTITVTRRLEGGPVEASSSVSPPPPSPEVGTQITQALNEPTAFPRGGAMTPSEIPRAQAWEAQQNAETANAIRNVPDAHLIDLAEQHGIKTEIAPLKDGQLDPAYREKLVQDLTDKVRGDITDVYPTPSEATIGQQMTQAQEQVDREINDRLNQVFGPSAPNGRVPAGVVNAEGVNLTGPEARATIPVESPASLDFKASQNGINSQAERATGGVGGAGMPPGATPGTTGGGTQPPNLRSTVTASDNYGKGPNSSLIAKLAADVRDVIGAPSRLTTMIHSPFFRANGGVGLAVTDWGAAGAELKAYARGLVDPAVSDALLREARSNPNLVIGGAPVGKWATDAPIPGAGYLDTGPRGRAGFVSEGRGPNVNPEAREPEWQSYGQSHVANAMYNAPVLGSLLQRSEASTAGQMNTLRLVTYAKEAERALQAGHTAPEYYDGIKKAVELATGRGTWNPLSVGGVSPFFSGRALSARFETPVFALARAAMHGEVLHGGGAVALRQLAGSVGFGTSMLALAQATGVADKVNMMPGASWLKAEFNHVTNGVITDKTTIDPFGGYGPIARLVLKVADAAAGGDQGAAINAGVQFARNQLGPVPGKVAEVFSGQDWLGRQIGSGGLPTSLGEMYDRLKAEGNVDTLRDLTVPIFANEMYDAFTHMGPAGIALALPSFGAMSTSSYGASLHEMRQSVLPSDMQYGDLFPKEKQALNSAIQQSVPGPYAEAQKTANELTDPAIIANQQARQQVKEDKAAQVAPILEGVRDGKYDPGAAYRAISEINHTAQQKEQALLKDPKYLEATKDFSNNDSLAQRALSTYYAIPSSYVGANGKIDWQKADATRVELIHSLAENGNADLARRLLRETETSNLYEDLKKLSPAGRK